MSARCARADKRDGNDPNVRVGDGYRDDAAVALVLMVSGHAESAGP